MDFKVGDYVRKKSGSAFKSRCRVETIIKISENPQHPSKAVAAVFSDGSCCNLDSLLIYERPTAKRLRDRLFSEVLVPQLRQRSLRSRYLILEDNNEEKYDCKNIPEMGRMRTSNIEQLYSIIVGIYTHFPESEINICIHSSEINFQIEWNYFKSYLQNINTSVETDISAPMHSFDDYFTIKPEFHGYGASTKYGL
jgi:hypothetical protein